MIYTIRNIVINYRVAARTGYYRIFPVYTFKIYELPGGKSVGN